MPGATNHDDCSAAKLCPGSLKADGPCEHGEYDVHPVRSAACVGAEVDESATDRENRLSAASLPQNEGGNSRKDANRPSSAAYTPPVGMKSLEQKLMRNGSRGADYFEPEWAEVRIVMRERDRYHEALAGIANADTKYPSMPSGFTGDWEVLRDEARAVLTEDELGVWE